MLIPSVNRIGMTYVTSLSRRVNANSQPTDLSTPSLNKLIKKGEC